VMGSRGKVFNLLIIGLKLKGIKGCSSDTFSTVCQSGVGSNLVLIKYSC